MEPLLPEYLAPNCVAEAARDLGVKDDLVRLALAEATVRQGKKVADWNVCVEVATQAVALEASALLAKARSAEIEARVRASTAAFHALQVTQRPTFVLESGIGDRVVFSGVWRPAPLLVAVESLLADAAAYQSWKAHFGEPPAS
jgi:predicted DsbA family dithiol-disulfide isomerase